jgi:hypothetical protein
MAQFDVAGAMQVLYRQLEETGWTWHTRSGPDEWDRGRMQIRIIHVSGRCEIRWRRNPEPDGGWGEITHAIDERLLMARSVPWNLEIGPYGTSRAVFENWLARTGDEISREAAAL